MNLKKIFGAFVLLLGLGTAAFAEEEGMYGKLTIGYGHGFIDYDDFNSSYYSPDFYYSGFEIMPAFGFQLPVFENKPFSLSLEGQLPIVIGGGDYAGYWDYDTVVVTPSVMCFFNWHFESDFPEPLQKLVPYGGLGFGLPIQHISWKYKYYSNSKYVTVEDSDTEIGFRVNLTFGARYDFTKQIGALVEYNYGFGTYAYSFRGGAVYRF
ncbi:MAG: outer membrane beta-barrel protein [Treponema sp.]|nr:outer membrane beta-barrel protein [Treponema sp.]